jgi:hypothetical protein
MTLDATHPAMKFRRSRIFAKFVPEYRPKGDR